MNTATTSNKNVLIFFSSPNPSGYTKQALDSVLSLLPQNLMYEVIDVYQTNIDPCTDCKACFEGECPLNNDGMGEILEKIKQAEIIIAATPIYFNAVPSKFKAIFDRMQQLFVKKVILHKPVFVQDKLGILITTAGSDNDFATDSIYAMFQMFFSSINAKFIEHIAIKNTDNQKTITLDEIQISNIMENIN